MDGQTDGNTDGFMKVWIDRGKRWIKGIIN
jgi:hypothetical protein